MTIEKPSWGRLDVLAVALLLIGLSYGYGSTLATGPTWANNGADSGDLIAASATMGVAHPTGYPTYLLLARLFQFLPIGSLAFRSSMCSAVTAVLAVVCVFRIVRGLYPNRSWEAVLGSLLAGVALGCSPLFWSQAIIAEVHSLNALFVAILLLCIGSTNRHPTDLIWQGLLAGLALGNHVTIIVVVLVWVADAIGKAPRGRRWAVLGCCMVGCALGLLVYLYLPLRASSAPPVNWGNPRDWPGFWWVVSGQLYRPLAFGLPNTFLAERAAAWASLLLRQFGPVGIVLGFVGLIYCAADARRFIQLTLAVAVCASLFAMTYNTADSLAYLIPSYMIFAIWIGIGLVVVCRTAARWHWSIAITTMIVAIGAITWAIPATFSQVDASQDRRAIDYAGAVLAGAPPGALIVTSADQDTFPLWYYHYALGWRSDVAVLVEPMLELNWYRDQLRTTYPQMRIPSQQGSGWLTTIAEANQRILCTTDPLNIPPLHCTSARSFIR